MGARWYAVPALAVGLVTAATLLLDRANNTRLRSTDNTSVVHDAEAIVDALERMADRCAAGPCVHLFSNSRQKWLSIPHCHLQTAQRELPALFDCYAMACTSSTVCDALRADVWNALCAVLEESLTAYVTADPLLVDASSAAASLAMGELLQGRYHIQHVLSLSTVQLYALPVRAIAEAACKNSADASVTHSLAVFARLLRTSCSPGVLVLLGAVVAATAAHLSRPFFPGATPPLATPASALYAASVLDALTDGTGNTQVSWNAFGARVMSCAPGRVLAAMTLGTLASHLVTAAKDAVSDELLRRLRSAIKTDTVLALARFDFVADPAWRIPHRVYGALSVATNFSLNDADRLMGVVADCGYRCRTLWASPLPCAVGWTTRQLLHYGQRQWTRACLMRGFVDAVLADGRATPPPSRGSANDLSSSLSERGDGHYGLQLLLLTATDAGEEPQAALPGLMALAPHVQWPLAPDASLHAAHRALRRLCEGGGDAALQAKCDALGALVDDAVQGGVATTALTHHSPKSAAPSFSALLGVRRSQGDVWPPPALQKHLAVSGAQQQRGELFSEAPAVSEDVVDRVITGLEGLPLMTALATRSRLDRASAVEDARAVEAAFQVTRAVEGGDLFGMPPVRPWSSVSAFQFDVEVAQMRYHEHETYAQSVAAILHVQRTHRPSIDGAGVASPHVWPDPSPVLPSSRPWRVTFEHVCFRYPGTDVEVLHDISFDVAPGAFLGIVGFSGAGKSTLLLLLTRVYAPTSGRICVDGCPIERFSARALRRRLGVSWQGDGNTRFLEGLSVERNIAFGALHRASSVTVADALAMACVDGTVAARPHGWREALHCSEWSGGEVGRLSIARALMVSADDAGAYLFDECTSGLDSVTEAKVFSRGLRSRRRVTQLMVSHRLASLQDADEIVVLDNGRIVQRGTWAELRRSDNDSTFQKLYAAQAIR